MESTFTRIAVRHLLVGDVLGGGTIMYAPYRNSKTPQGKVTVEYKDRKGYLVVAHWNPSTIVMHKRPDVRTVVRQP